MAVILRNQPFSKFFLHFGMNNHLRINILLESNCLSFVLLSFQEFHTTFSFLIFLQTMVFTFKDIENMLISHYFESILIKFKK